MSRPCFGQLEVADDLRPQQADDVARDREPEARDDLLRDRGAAEHVPALQDDGLEAGAGEVRGGDEAVVAAADDHRVVALRHPVPPLCNVHRGHAVYRTPLGRAARVLVCVHVMAHWSAHMALVRINITLPEETLALVDAVAGPRGRSAYIAEVVPARSAATTPGRSSASSRGRSRARRPGARRDRRSTARCVSFATAGIVTTSSGANRRRGCGICWTRRS